MFLPLNAVLGSHRDVDPVMFGVKHTFLTKRSSPDNYIHGAAADAAGIDSTSSICPCECPRFDCHFPCKRIWRKAEASAQCIFYFVQVREYRDQFRAAELSPTWKVTSVASQQQPRHVAFASVKRDENQQKNDQVFETPS